MSLQESLLADLLQKKSTIVKAWVDQVFASYPAEAAKIMKNNSDRFANPIGQTLAPACADLFDILVTDADPGQLAGPLDDMVRLRAIQTFSPAESLDFIFQLKKLIRAEADASQAEELLVVEDRIDALALQAFNIYVDCREQLYKIRVNELQNRTCRIVERQNRKKGGSD